MHGHSVVGWAATVPEQPPTMTRENVRALLGMTALVVVVFLLWFAFGWRLYTSTVPLTTRAEIGEAFGMLAALFSGLAFAGVIFTIWLQRKELKLQRLELKLTRQELEQTAVAQKETARLQLAQYWHIWSEHQPVFKKTGNSRLLDTPLPDRFQLDLRNGGADAESLLASIGQPDLGFSARADKISIAAGENFCILISPFPQPGTSLRILLEYTDRVGRPGRATCELTVSSQCPFRVVRLEPLHVGVTDEPIPNT
jgi:hypothetical protein